MTTGRACDGCTLCCKLLGIPELQKPMGVWCPHVIKGRGCGIYEQRPHPCRAFECLWLMTDMADHWKPDRSNMVVAGDEAGTVVSIIVDSADPEAWTRNPHYSDIKAWAHKGLWRIEVLPPGQSWIIFPEEDLLIRGRRPDDLIVSSGYKRHASCRQPAVSVQHADGSVTEVLGRHYPLQ